MKRRKTSASRTGARTGSTIPTAISVELASGFTEIAEIITGTVFDWSDAVVSSANGNSL